MGSAHKKARKVPPKPATRVRAALKDSGTRKRAEDERPGLAHELEQRMKELSCLYGLARIIETPGISLEDIFQRSVNLLPAAFQYPEITCARIVLENREYRTNNYAVAKRQLSAEMKLREEGIGQVEVRYLQEKPVSTGGPFLEEERNLINAIAERLSRVVDRMRVEQALKDKLEELRRLVTVVSDSNDAVIMHDFDGKILAWNRGAKETYGYTEAEALRMNVRDIVAEPDREAALTLIQKIKQGEIVRSFELRRVTKDGRILDVWLTTTLLRDEKGKPVAIATTERDITERKRAENKVREQAALLDLANDAVLVRNMASEIMFWSRGAEQTYGWTKAEASGQVTHTLLSTVFPLAREALDKTLLTESQWEGELTHTRRDGAQIVVASRQVLRRDDRGQPIGILEINRDITERKQAETERLARQAAEAANAAKSEFLSRMSHELRTPMNSILGFAQLLEMSSKEPLTPGQHERVKQILKGGQMLLEIINEVLDLSRIESGRMTISPEPVEVRPVLEEVVGLVNPLAAERGIQVNMPDVPANQFVKADRQRIKQVLLNLSGNAIKYNREGGTVTLSCGSLAPGWLRISVNDTGRGIAADKLPQLFTPFERIGVEERLVEGTGLGLALSKHLVELMGGRIGVESVVGEGSTFWFDLSLTESPVARSEPKARTQPAESLVPARTLLYIEDNLSNYELVKQVLSDQPQIEVLWAMQGGIGLHLAEQRRPDLILLDLHLPDMHGADVLESLQNGPATRLIPVIVLSADATPNQIKRLMQAGARAYLTKPLDVKEFLQAVEKLLA